MKYVLLVLLCILPSLAYFIAGALIYKNGGYFGYSVTNFMIFNKYIFFGIAAFIFCTDKTIKLVKKIWPQLSDNLLFNRIGEVIVFIVTLCMLMMFSALFWYVAFNFGKVYRV